MKKETIRSIVCIFALLSAIMVTVTPAAAVTWWDSDWHYKRAITINTTSNLINYQVNVNITYDSDMQTDFADIRFTNEEEDTELDYWIESKSGGEWCNVWVEVDSIDTNNGTQAYMYYCCNQSVASASNGTNVFEFFDDFDDGNISDWTLACDGNCGYGQSHSVSTTYANSPPYSIRHYHWDSSEAGGYLHSYKNFSMCSSGQYVVGFYSIDHYDHGFAPHLSRVIVDTTEIYNSHNGSFSYHENTTSLSAGSHTIKVGFYNQCPYSGWCSGNYYSYFDDIRIRKYADTEPGASVGEEETFNIVYLEPANSSASFCEETTVQVYANTTEWFYDDLFQGGQFNITYDPTCANVTNVVFNPIWNDTFTTWWDTYTNGYTRVGFGAATPAEMVNGSVWICNLTIHCVCETNCNTTLNFASTTKLVNDFGAEVKAHWLDGTFNGTAAPPPPPASIINLTNVTGNFWINWTWENPADADFNHTIVYINGTFETNTSNEYYNLTNLSPHATKTISTHTVDTSGNVNETWVNQTTTIPNNDPVLEAIGGKTVDEGQTVTIDVNATDLDGDNLTYYCNRTDLFADFNRTTGIGSGTPPSGQAGTYYVDFGVADGFGGIDTETVRIIVLDKTPPASISNLSYTNGTTWINWTWTNPADADFNYTMLYLNGTWQTNTSYPFYNATDLDPDTCYEIGTHTVDKFWNVNKTWVNQTAKAQADISERLVFDTGEGTYPSIFGTHKGKIVPDKDIMVHKMYTYPCTGTGGHAEYVKIWNSTLNVSASWNGYKGDWHNISFSKSFILKADEIYYYEIITGSYPQIIHASSKEVTGGTITCDKFIDANGRIYHDWIPAIRFFW